MAHQHHYPAPPRRRTSPLAIVAVVAAALVGLIVVAVVVVVAAGGSDGTTPGAKPSTHPAGSTVTDDQFGFRVTSVSTASRIKSDGGTDRAKGRFIKVQVAVTNKAAKPRFINADDQQLRAGGKGYGVDVNATVDADKGPEVGLPEKINGGATETILLVFDVPAGATPTTLEVHGSEVSGGQLLALPGA